LTSGDYEKVDMENMERKEIERLYELYNMDYEVSGTVLEAYQLALNREGNEDHAINFARYIRGYMQRKREV
jgi:hypothetical protein